jgi:hypothetical protein
VRILARPPENTTRQEIELGYQLCARCGHLMLIGELAEIVSRSFDWQIYSHPHRCARREPVGWRVLKRIDLLQGKENDEKKVILREAVSRIIEGLELPAVCILNDEQIQVELSRLPDPERGWDFVFTAENDDLKAILEEAEPREVIGPRHRTAIPALHDDGTEDESQGLQCICRRVPLGINRVEQLLIAKLATHPSALSADATLLRAVQVEERERTHYITGALPKLEPPLVSLNLDYAQITPDLIARYHGEPGPVGDYIRDHVRKSRTLGRNPSTAHKGSVNLRDHAGKAVERALYHSSERLFYMIHDWPLQRESSPLYPILLESGAVRDENGSFVPQLQCGEEHFKKLKRPRRPKHVFHPLFGQGKTVGRSDTDHGLAYLVHFLDNCERRILVSYLTPKPRKCKKSFIPDSAKVPSLPVESPSPAIQ